MELIGMKAIKEHVRMSEATVLSWIREAEFPAKKIRGRGIWISDTDAIAMWRKGYVAGEVPGKGSPRTVHKNGGRKTPKKTP